MNKLIAVICIFIVQFLIGFFMFFLVQDSAITQVSGLNLQNYNTPITFQNTTAVPDNAISASSNVYNMLSAMFSFSVPSLPGFPPGIAIIVSFINYLFIIAEIILIALIIFQDIVGNVNIKLF